MSRNTLASLIDAFNTQSNQVKTYLVNLLEIVKEGRVPSTETIGQLNRSVEQLQNQYQEIYQVAKVALSDDKLLPNGTSVPELATAVAESQSRLMKAQLERTQAVLAKFIRVQSLIEAFAKALVPYQTAASALLDQLTLDNLEELLPQAKAPESFLEAMSCNDLYTPDGIALMKQVQQAFPELEIQMGLNGGKYYIPSQDVPKTISSTSQAQTIAADTEVLAQNPAKPAANSILPDQVPTALNLSSGTEPQDNADSGNEQELSGSAETDGICYPVLNHAKTGNPSAASFKKEIEKMARSARAIRIILPLFTNLGVLSKEQIPQFTVCLDYPDSNQKQAIFAAVDGLASKGYLACFANAEGQELYCLSDYACKCLHKERIRQARELFFISIGNINLSAAAGVNREQADCFYRNNQLLLHYLVIQKDHLTNAAYNVLLQSIKWKGTSYQVLVFEGSIQQIAILCTSLSDAVASGADVLLVPQALADQMDSLSKTCRQIFVIGTDTVCALHPSCSAPPQPQPLDSVDNSAPFLSEAETGQSAAAAPGEALTTPTPYVPASTDPPVLSQEEPAPQVDVEPSLPSTPPEPCPEQLTPEGLLALQRTPTDQEFCTVIFQLLDGPVDRTTLSTDMVNAALLVKGAAQVDNCPVSSRLSRQLSLATRLLLGEDTYSSECLSTAFSNEQEDIPAFILAAYMNALLTPAMAYDYGLKGQAEQYFSRFNKGDLFEGLEAFKPLFNQLLHVRAGGFTPAVISLLGDAAESERFLNGLRRDAASNLTINPPKTRMKALPILYNTEFGPGSELYQCMESIASNDSPEDTLELIDLALSFYGVDVDDHRYSLHNEAIENRLNEAWDKINSSNSKTRFKLEYDARDLALRQYQQRLDIMIKWAEHIRSRMKGQKEIEQLRTQRNQILHLIDQLWADPSWKNARAASVLTWSIQYMREYLSGTFSQLKLYSDLLYTGVFSLSSAGTPELNLSLSRIKYYELWRNALRHIVCPRQPADKLVAEILGETSGQQPDLKDNLRQLIMLGQLLGSKDERYTVCEEQIKEAAAAADLYTVHFNDELELAYTYYRINETEKETLSGMMKQYQSYFYEIGDFACWRNFLGALKQQLFYFEEGRKKELSDRLTVKLDADPGAPLLQKARQLLEEENNFAVTEEYLNRYESGQRDLDYTVTPDFNYFSEFLSPDVFNPLFQECKRWKGKALRTFGWWYLENRLPKEWTNRLRESTKDLISHWPTGKNTANAEQVKALLCRLGIAAIDAVAETGKKEEIWDVTVQPTAKGLADYLHPIAAFGTKMKSPLHVIFLYGNHTERQLVDTVTSLNLGSISLVFIDLPIDVAQRRYIGEIFHTQKTGRNPFLLVDQVLFLYLAGHQETERLPAMLQCTLPYTTYQPFLRDGGSTADEMFCGRTLELNNIIDPNGACVVYGGRQLGKTALLERAESCCSKPQDHAFAIYSTIRWKSTEADVVDTLIYDINRKAKDFIALTPCQTIREMCIQLSALFQSGKIKSMHLLIDEVDDFLGAIAQDSYQQLQPLVDLKRETKNNFKFVIAGLHNVCRAKNATRANGIFGQLGTPLCIKPLSPIDAMQLLSRPLRYLGFQIDQYPHLETILTNTNYYPGILQFFGYILVETLTGQYSKYYHAANGNPPFTLQDEQLGAVMNSADLNKSIKDKFRWSLELDPRYFMIARCITVLYHLHEDDRMVGNWQGFSIREVMDVADLYQIHCLAPMSPQEYTVLMDEMVEMGILSKPTESTNRYRLRRSSFIDIIGESLDVLEADIVSNNTEV